MLNESTDQRTIHRNWNKNKTNTHILNHFKKKTKKKTSLFCSLTLKSNSCTLFYPFCFVENKQTVYLLILAGENLFGNFLLSFSFYLLLNVRFHSIRFSFIKFASIEYEFGYEYIVDSCCCCFLSMQHASWWIFFSFYNIFLHMHPLSFLLSGHDQY